ncbi:MAG: FecR domain-containing protein [Paucibacter sp.]|nr:FecR domain-containing protein [Roseateles sp.]
MKKYLVAQALALGLCIGAQAQQGPLGPNGSIDPIGRIKRLTGTVTVERGGKTVAVSVSSALLQSDCLRTGADGYVGLTLADDTLLTAGPGSVLVLTRFAFDPTTQDGELKVSLPRGRVHVVSGLIAKKAPENVEFKGRNVALEVRGAEFLLAVPGETE